MLVLTSCVSVNSISDAGVCAGLKAPLDVLTDEVVLQGPKLIKGGFSEVVVSTERLATAYDAGCLQDKEKLH
jgi:hypothetical protein